MKMFNTNTMRALTMLAIGLLVSHCGDEQERQEVVAKLRAIGAGSTPVVPVPSEGATISTATLAVYAALPIGQTITATTFKDSDSVSSIPLDASAQVINTASATYTNHKGVALYSVNVTLTIPQLAIMQKLPSLISGSGKVRYGIMLESGGEVEKIVGDVLVYPATATQHNWVAPVVDIAAPIQGATFALNSAQDIQATITDANTEGVKVGWFVSNGEVTNRRAKNTKWKITEAGEQTLIVTVHGKKSKGFAVKAVTVTSAP